jgi:ProP effector
MHGYRKQDGPKVGCPTPATFLSRPDKHMNKHDPKPARRNVLLENLGQHFAVLREAKPLALGIHLALIQRFPEVSSKELRTALRIHTSSTRYLKALTSGGTRFDLDENPSGEVSKEQREAAAKELQDRFAKGAERKRQEEQARKTREEQERRQEKLNALADKFKKS